MSSLSRGDFHPLPSTSSTTTFLTDLSMGVAQGSEKYTKGREKFEIISGIFGYKVVDYHSSLEVSCPREKREREREWSRFKGGKKAVISTRQSIDTTERIIMRKEIILNEKHPSPTVIIISILH